MNQQWNHEEDEYDLPYNDDLPPIYFVVAIILMIAAAVVCQNG